MDTVNKILNSGKGYIFDLDGTLTLTQHLHFQAFSEVFKRYGIEYTEHDDRYKYAGTGSKYIFPTVFAEYGKTLSQEEIVKLSAEKRALYDEILERSSIQAVPGVLEFLFQAQQKGIKMIVATGNKAEETEIILVKARIVHFFDIIVSQKDVKNQKPAPDIFLLAAQKLNLVPQECIVFEDGINGVKAAKAAGMYCVALDTSVEKEQLVKAGADTIINNYFDLLA